MVADGQWLTLPLFQGSVLGPHLFNIFLSDLFLVVKDVNIASYADDNTLYDSVIL